MNIFKREMKANRKSLIIWCIGMIVMVFGGMAKFGALETSGASVNELMDSLPKGLQSMFGLGIVDLSTVGGYFSILFLYLIIMATIHSSMLGATIISKEERDKTAEFLFAKPVSRNKAISLKVLATLVNIIILNLVALFSSISAVASYNKGDSINGDIIRLMIGMFILQILFMSIGMGIAAISKNPKISVSISTGFLLFSYLLFILIDMNENIEWLKYLTPFKYFEAKNIMLGSGFEMVYIALSLFIIGLFMTLTYVFYKKRDLTV
ncbi:MAG: ABC transporter permease subunit [Clostridiaceae bacterium]